MLEMSKMFKKNLKKTIKKLEEIPKGSTVILSAHGVTPAIREQAMKNAGINKRQLEERFREIERLLLEYRSPVSIQGDGKPFECLECKVGNVYTNDKLGGGDGGTTYYTPFYYCKTCGYHEIGEEMWTTDY